MNRLKLLTLSAAFAVTSSLALPNLAFTDEVDLEAIERRAAELERLIDEAAEDDNEERVRELNEARERLERLASIERERRDDDEEEEEEEHGHYDDDHDEHEEEMERHHRHMEHHALELELHHMELKLEKTRLELKVARQEVAIRAMKLASDRQAVAALAIQQLVHTTERPEHAAEMLFGLLRETKEPGTRRLIQLHLSKVLMHARQPERAREVLRQLIAPRREPVRARENDRDRDGDRDGEDGDRTRRGNAERNAERNVLNSRRIMRIFSTYDKNRNEAVDIDEWMAMKEGKMTDDRWAKEKRLFDQIAGDDERITAREFAAWQVRRSQERERD